MPFAFVFPGQGSQSVGMLAELGSLDAIVRDTFDEASGVLNYDLWKRVQEGPREALDATECTQPAMLSAGVATYRLWRKRGGPDPQTVSGHSLGEFSALVCAGVLDFPAAVELVRFRGQVMQEAVPAGTGAMAAILGLDDPAVEAACEEAAHGEVVAPANYNAPQQVVIAGQTAAVQRAIELARAKGAKRALILPVSVPSHTVLMRTAATRLGERLADIALHPPRLPYLSPVDVRLHEDPNEIREHLVRQLSSPVRWTDAVRALVAAGASQVIECGPGKVLTGINRRIERRPELGFLALEDAVSLQAAESAIKGDTPGVRHA